MNVASKSTKNYFGFKCMMFLYYTEIMLVAFV